MPSDRENDTAPPANTGLLVAAGVCVLIPIVALMWVGSYAREDPKLGPVPFFIWYQMMWVFLCAGFTSIAYRLVLRARPHRPMSVTQERPAPRPDGEHGPDEEGPTV